MLDRFFARVFALILKIVLFAIGLVVVAVVMSVLMLFLGLWLLRSAWARITGRPVMPWVMRFNPGSAWQSVNRYATAVQRREAPVEDRLRGRVEADDVVDVRPKGPAP